MLSLQRYLIFLLISAITLPLLTNGLKCKCTDDCPEESMCEGAVCYAQYYSDVSGKHWNLRKGCLDTLSSVICQYTKSDSHTNVCCNDTDYCNANLITTLPPVVSCLCNGKNCDKDGLCTLDPSANQSCYTVFSRLGTTISRQRGCATKCKEYHRDSKIKKCCQEDKCNNEAVPIVWPSPPSAVVTTAAPAPPTTDSVSPDILTSEQPTTLDPRRPKELICHCSGCRDGRKTCLAAVACASHVVETVKMTWCVQDEFSCRNNSTFQLNCCYNDYCNGPSRPIPGPPCDDEDTESSGGCDFGLITSSTALPSPATTSIVSIEATPTSSTTATPTETITEDTDTESQYDNSDMMMIFYFFTVLLSLCIITMIIVVVACVVMVCHYRGMAYKTVLSSTTILESAMKEKGFPITNSSPV